MSDIFYGLRESDVSHSKKKCNDDSSTATDSFIDSFVGMIGGNRKIPNGGYPPITLCINDKSDDSPKKSNKDLKKREYSTNDNLKNLSIHQILDDRKKKPIFEF